MGNGAAANRTCTATNKRGEPCSARAVTAEGLCAIHGGLVDPQEIGRKGGQASVASKRSTLAGALRERGRQELGKLVHGQGPAHPPASGFRGRRLQSRARPDRELVAY
jgi:hypothetical protein